MNGENKAKKFEMLGGKIESEEAQLRIRFNRISTLRVITFVAGIALLLIGFADHVALAETAGIFSIFIFIWLIVRHGKISYSMEVANSRLKAVRRYADRQNDNWKKFPEDGHEYIDEESVVATDIDLLGANSLYQMINVAHTELGRQKLAEAMKLKAFDADITDGRRKSVAELMDKPDFAVDFEAAGIRLDGRRCKPDIHRMEQACKSDYEGLPIWCRLAAVILPLVEITLIALGIAGVIGLVYPIAVFFAVLSFSWVTRRVTDSVIMPLYGMENAAMDYLDMMSVIKDTKFSSDKLVSIREHISGEGGTLAAFGRLKSISQAYNISFNPLLHQLLSGIILWDYQLAAIVIAWQKKYGSAVSGCFDELAEIEILLSFAVLGFVRDTGTAEINTDYDGKCALYCEDIYHPLISPDSVVANSVTLTHGLTVITGSNMSGKTTFLRTIAINLALAYMGAPICGRALRGGYMKLFTSMRITDDVSSGTSTFYAEILRIKRMAEYRHRNEPMLCLIDEIFKGTNSADRIVGAREVLKGLSGERCMTLVSTHDFELCSVEDSAGHKALNYHFEEYYDMDELKFDYKIRNGRCTTTNARAILRMAGFPVPDESS